MWWNNVTKRWNYGIIDALVIRKKYERNMTGVSYVNELNYHTMIVNAQTGEFMNPVEQKEKLVDCPKIITWEDVQ